MKVQVKCTNKFDRKNLSFAILRGEGFTINVTAEPGMISSIVENAVYYVSVFPRDGSN